MLNALTRFRRAPRLLAASTVVASAVTTSPASAAVAGQATWNAPDGGSSKCVQVTTTTVVCDHKYSSISVIAGRLVETCVTAGLYVGAPPITPPYVDTCHAELDVTTSGTGKLVTANGAVCDTLAIERLEFSIATPYGFYTLAVTVNNNEVTSTVNGRRVLADNVLFSNVTAAFTGGCGLTPTRGAFSGYFNVGV